MGLSLPAHKRSLTIDVVVGQSTEAVAREQVEKRTKSRCGAVNWLLLLSVARRLIKEGVWWLRTFSSTDAAVVTRCFISRRGCCLVSMATPAVVNSCSSQLPISDFNLNLKTIPGCVRLCRWRRDEEILEGGALGGCVSGCGWSAAWAPGWLQKASGMKPSNLRQCLFFSQSLYSSVCVSSNHQ